MLIGGGIIVDRTNKAAACCYIINIFTINLLSRICSAELSRKLLHQIRKRESKIKQTYLDHPFSFDMFFYFVPEEE